MVREYTLVLKGVLFVEEIIINGRLIHATNFKQEIDNELTQICFDFKVTSEDYHDITALLYEGSFDINVPNKGLAFRGNIQEYSTSITNLYEKGNVGDFKLCLREVKA